MLFYPEFALWCGTTETADWHVRYRAMCSVYGHLHIPRTTYYDGVRFEEVSVGYPREWQRRGLPDNVLRQILPVPDYPPGTLNKWGGHFTVTPRWKPKPRSFGRNERRNCGDGVDDRIPGRCTRRSDRADRSGRRRCRGTVLRPTGPGGPPSGGTPHRQSGREASPRVHRRATLCASGDEPARRRTGPDPQGRQGCTGLATRSGRSLTHCDGYRGAVLGYSLQVRSLGIDAEPHDRLPDGVLDAVSLDVERTWLASATDTDLHWDRVLFCAKEATYKAWFPLTGRWLGFEDAHITFERDESGATSGTFRSKLLVPGDTSDGPPLTGFDGRWLVDDGLVLTAITVR